MLNSPRFAIKFILLESLIDKSFSRSSFTRQRFICTTTNFSSLLLFLTPPSPPPPPPTKRKKGWKQVRNIVHYVHKLWLPLPPSHSVGPDLQPSDYRFGSFVGRCSFHSDQILPHGRSKLGKSTTCTTNEHGPSDTKREREREREAPLPVLFAESQSERINRITRVPACAHEFKPSSSLVLLYARSSFRSSS